jgi:hypothetical protein
MGFLSNLFGGGSSLPQKIDKGLREEAEKLIVELIEIVRKDDYLSEHPGGLFNGQCHNIRARAIGRRLNEIGGLELMQTARERVRRKLKMTLASHLDYSWTDIGKWMP